MEEEEEGGEEVTTVYTPSRCVDEEGIMPYRCVRNIIM